MNDEADYTVVINIKTKNHMNFFNCLWSLYDCDQVPKKIIICCDNYSKSLAPVFELGDLADFDIIKSRTEIYDWGFMDDLVQTRYVLHIDDTSIITDPQIFQKCINQHAHSFLLRNYNWVSEDRNPRSAAHDKQNTYFLKKVIRSL